MNIATIQALIALGNANLNYSELEKVIEDLKDRVKIHDAQMN